MASSLHLSLYSADSGSRYPQRRLPVIFSTSSEKRKLEKKYQNTRQVVIAASEISKGVWLSERTPLLNPEASRAPGGSSSNLLCPLTAHHPVSCHPQATEVRKAHAPRPQACLGPKKTG